MFLIILMQLCPKMTKYLSKLHKFPSKKQNFPPDSQIPHFSPPCFLGSNDLFKKPKRKQTNFYARTYARMLYCIFFILLICFNGRPLLPVLALLKIFSQIKQTKQTWKFVIESVYFYFIKLFL